MCYDKEQIEVLEQEKAEQETIDKPQYNLFLCYADDLI